MGARYCVACAYTKGEGVAADPAAATAWLEKAAEGGHVEAQAYTAQAYNTGSGVAAAGAYTRPLLIPTSRQGVAFVSKPIPTQYPTKECFR